LVVWVIAARELKNRSFERFFLLTSWAPGEHVRAFFAFALLHPMALVAGDSNSSGDAALL
jgi:hypothetical protein